MSIRAYASRSGGGRASVWEAIVALVFDPANRSALADLIMVQQGIAPDDPVARALISAAGADPDVVLRPS